MDSPPNADWVKRCDAALRYHGPTGGPLTIAHVLETPGGQFHYSIAIGSKGSSARIGETNNATVTFRQSAETAAAIRSGKLAPGEALLLGKVTVSGNASSLLEHRELLAEIDAVILTVN